MRLFWYKVDDVYPKVSKDTWQHRTSFRWQNIRLRQLRRNVCDIPLERLQALLLLFHLGSRAHHIHHYTDKHIPQVIRNQELKFQRLREFGVLASLRILGCHCHDNMVTVSMIICPTFLMEKNGETSNYSIGEYTDTLSHY